jgi:hypothetical protein
MERNARVYSSSRRSLIDLGGLQGKHNDLLWMGSNFAVRVPRISPHDQRLNFPVGSMGRNPESTPRDELELSPVQLEKPRR